MSKHFCSCCAAISVLASLIAVNQLAAQEQTSTAISVATNASRYSGETAARRIAGILAEPLRTPLAYEEEELHIVLEQMEEEYGIPIVFDKSALDEVAISPETSVSMRLRKISLRSALNLMFKEPGLEDLCYIIDEEVLLITTEDKANETLMTRVYRVDDLLNSQPRRFNDTKAHEFPDSLIDVLVTTIACDSWMENGTGDGEAQFFPPGMLVVSQTRRVHEQIESLFDQMRVTKDRILRQSAATASKPIPATQGFVLDVDFGENAEEEQQRLTEVIKKSVNWSQAEPHATSDEAWIELLPDRLLVRHVPTVLSQVETVLADMRVLDRKHHPRGGGGIGCSPVVGGGGKPAKPDLAE